MKVSQALKKIKHASHGLIFLFKIKHAHTLFPKIMTMNGPQTLNNIKQALHG